MLMKNKNSITASAPGKLMLTGGYAVVHGQPTIVTAVDQSLSVTVQKNGQDTFHLYAPDLGIDAYSKTIDDLGKKELPKAVRFVEILYKNFLERFPQSEGINVTTNSEFSSSFGFGSSSAVTVAFAKALTSLYELDFSNDQLFDICYQAVIEVQGVGSGFDIAAAIWGGTLYYVSPAKIVKPIVLEKLPIVVGYTGIKADTPTLIRMINSDLNRKPAEIKQVFSDIGQISNDLEEKLLASDWSAAGGLLNSHQQQMRELGVSSIELERLINASLDAGALGATLSGAGGGDCMVALVDDKSRKKVGLAIEEAGGRVIEVNLQAPGVRIEN